MRNAGNVTRVIPRDSHPSAMWKCVYISSPHRFIKTLSIIDAKVAKSQFSSLWKLPIVFPLVCYLLTRLLKKKPIKITRWRVKRIIFCVDETLINQAESPRALKTHIVMWINQVIYVYTHELFRVIDSCLCRWLRREKEQTTVIKWATCFDKFYDDIYVHSRRKFINL